MLHSRLNFKVFFYAEFLLLAFLYPALLQAQWERLNGPTGGNIGVLIRFKEKIYAANTSGSGYFSGDTATLQWKPAGLLEEYNIKGLAVQKDSILYALTSQGQVFGNTSGQWIFTESINQNEGLQYITASMDKIAVASSDVIYILSANGTSWKQYLFSNKEVSCIKFINNKLWVGSRKSGLFVLEQDGVFKNKEFGSKKVTAIAERQNLIVVGTSDLGIYISDSNESNFQPFNSGLEYLFITSIVSDNNSSLLAGTAGRGVYLSKNGAEKWISVNSEELKLSQVNTLLLEDNKVLACIYNKGIFQTLDLGRTWNSSNGGLTAIDISSIKKKQNTILTGVMQKGVYTSTDGGKVFSLFEMDGTGKTNFNLASSRDSFFCGTKEGILISPDGKQWPDHVGAVGNEDVSYMKGDGDTLYSCAESGIYVTIDGGISWNLRYKAGVTIISLSANKQEIIVGTDNAGIFISKGNDLTLLNQGLPSRKLPDSGIKTVRSIANTAFGKFAGIDGEGLFACFDNQNWRPFPIVPTADTVYDLLEINSALCAATNRGIFVYNVREKVWRNSTSQFSTSVAGLSLFADGTHLYAGLRGKSLYRLALQNIFKPSINILSGKPYCRGDSVKLYGSGIAPFHWNIDGKPSIVADTIIVRLSDGLKVVLNDKDGKVDSLLLKTDAVEICHPIFIIGTSVACPGDSIQLVANTDGGVKWYNEEDLSRPISSLSTLSTVFNSDISFTVVGGFGQRASKKIGNNIGSICFPVRIEGDSLVCPEEKVILNAKGDTQFWWTSPLLPNDTLGTNNTLQITLDKSGIIVLHGIHGGVRSFNLYIKDVKECFPIKIYEAITPNGDGKNDFFYIENISHYQNSVSVYDKWGSEVFHKDGYDNAWDGLHLHTNYYYYIIRVGDEVYKGSLLIKR